MKWKLWLIWFASVVTEVSAHEIVFCGERIPVNNDFVAQKLMNVIRRQIPNVNLPHLRKRVESNFPIVEYYLRETGLPEDFKYLPIVESGFVNATSKAGARGFWQLMPETAMQLGLIVSSTVDERDDIYKSTYAACKHLASYYLQIKKKYGISSWVLTAAAYNFGLGAMYKAIDRQGNDYFSMKLNEETAHYVYKIIAVKELFEYPELYMSDFGYNVFNVVKPQNEIGPSVGKKDSLTFNSMTVNVSTKDGKYPESIVVKEAKSVTVGKEAPNAEMDRNNFSYLAAVIRGKYKNFQDGELVNIELLENLELKGSFNRRGNFLKGKGWVIGERIFIDLGYGSHEVTLLDINGKKGLSVEDLKKGVPVLLKVSNSK